MENCKANKTNMTGQECTKSLAAVGDALYAIGGKWKLPIIIALRDGARRFNDLQRTITGISAKVLSAELKDMELNGFVKRNVFAHTPVVVEYELTGYSDTLGGVLSSLREWGMMHREKIKTDSMKEHSLAS